MKCDLCGGEDNVRRYLCTNCRPESGVHVLILEMGLSGATLQEIGDVINMTRERARQILRKYNVATSKVPKERRWSRLREIEMKKYGDICEKRFAEGKMYAEIAEELGVSRRVVQDILTELIPEIERRVRWAQPSRDKAMPREEMLEAIKSAGSIAGKTPSIASYTKLLDNKSIKGPTAPYIARRFGSWNKAVELAGFDPTPHTERGNWGKARYSYEDFQNAFQRVEAELNRSPSFREYEGYRQPGEPSGPTFRLRFYGWLDVKKSMSKIDNQPIKS